MKSREKSEDNVPSPKEIIQKKARLQKIYNHLLAVAEENKTNLQTVHELIEKVFSDIYEHNDLALNTEASGLLTAELAKKAGESAEPFVKTLREIQADLTILNDQIKAIPTAIKLLSGKAHDLNDARIQKRIDSQLDNLNALNKRYRETLELLHTHAMMLGKTKLADPNQKAELNTKLKQLHEQVLALKEQAKEKRKSLQGIDDAISRPRPSKL